MIRDTSDLLAIVPVDRNGQRMEVNMRIKRILSQHRRDFTAEYECEHCGKVHVGQGYDDANFHNNVIPNMVCKSCGKKAGKNYRPLATKYPEGMEV